MSSDKCFAAATEEAVRAFREQNPWRTAEEEIAFIGELTAPWLDKPDWWLRKFLTKRERGFVALIKAARIRDEE